MLLKSDSESLSGSDGRFSAGSIYKWKIYNI